MLEGFPFSVCQLLQWKEGLHFLIPSLLISDSAKPKDREKNMLQAKDFLKVLAANLQSSTPCSLAFRSFDYLRFTRVINRHFSPLTDVKKNCRQRRKFASCLNNLLPAPSFTRLSHERKARDWNHKSLLSFPE